MSLFKARDWWSTTSGCEEFYDIGCLCVANVDNSPSGHGEIMSLNDPCSHIRHAYSFYTNPAVANTICILFVMNSVCHCRQDCCGQLPGAGAYLPATPPCILPGSCDP